MGVFRVDVLSRLFSSSVKEPTRDKLVFIGDFLSGLKFLSVDCVLCISLDFETHRQRFSPCPESFNCWRSG